MTTEQARLQGVWENVEVTTTGPNASTYRAQPGLAIFTGDHYSLIHDALGENPRTGPADEAKATADELREMLRFTANAGTHATKGGDLILHPVVALRSSAMAPGATLTFSYKLEGNSLWLTQKSNQRGPVTNPPTLKLRRIQ